MTKETWSLVMSMLAKEIKMHARTAKQARTIAREFAKRHGFSYLPGEPAYIYEPGDVRVIMITTKPNGGIHMDLAYSPAYALLGEFDIVMVDKI